MSSDRRQPFSLALLRGSDAGKVLRTRRRRITVGGAPDNDFVLRDPEVRAHHFAIDIDGEDWRVSAIDGPELALDRRWRHPESGVTGAKVQLGAAEILLFPGDLDPTALERELTPSMAVTADSGELAPIEPSYGERTVRTILPQEGPTQPEADPTFLASLPTLADARRPVAAPEVTIATPSPPRQSPESLAAQATEAHRKVEPRRHYSELDTEPGVEGQPLDLRADVVALPVEGRSRTNAWGDPIRGGAEPARALVPAPEPRPPTPLPTDEPRALEIIGATPNRSLERAPGIRIAGEKLAQSKDPALSVLRRPDGEYATRTRLLGTRLQELIRTYGYRAYMLTSAEPLTGKTTIGVNLAFALAEDPNRRVAFIEANFRQPRLHEILDIPKDHGLIGILEGRQEVADAIVKVPGSNLVLFPSGGTHPHPGEILAAPRFKTLISELADTVDIAIVDAPAVRSAADTNLLLPMVDGVLLVVLEGSTKAAWIDEAREQLGSERILGALMNQVSPAIQRSLEKERRRRTRGAES